MPEEAVKMHILEIPQSEWKKCFENWFKRMQNCIDLHAEYFEKTMKPFSTINFGFFLHSRNIKGNPDICCSPWHPEQKSLCVL